MSGGQLLGHKGDSATGVPLNFFVVPLNFLNDSIRSLRVQQQLKGVCDVASDDEGPDNPKSMEDDMTPEMRPQPQEIAGHLYDKWDTAP